MINQMIETYWVGPNDGMLVDYSVSSVYTAYLELVALVICVRHRKGVMIASCNTVLCLLMRCINNVSGWSPVMLSLSANTNHYAQPSVRGVSSEILGKVDCMPQPYWRRWYRRHS